MEIRAAAPLRARIRVLLVEDNPGDARLVRESLSLAKGSLFEVESATRLDAALARLADASYDVVLLDLGLPDSRGLDGLHRMRLLGGDHPIVVLTGVEDEELAAEALARGAQDYVEKTRLEPDLIARTIRYAIARKRSEERFRDLLESAPDAMVIVDAEGRITLVNGQAERLFGHPRQALLGQEVEVLIPSANRAAHVAHRQGYAHDPRVRPMGSGLQLAGRRADGSEFPVEISLSPLNTPEGPLVSAAIRDVTDRRKAEAALRRENEFVRLLQVVATAANLSKRAEDAFRTCVSAVCELTGWPLGHVYVAEPEALRPTDLWHVEGDFHAFREATMKTPLPSGVGLPGLVRERRAPEWTFDMQGESSPRAPAAADAGLASGFAFPVLVGDDVVAVLEFFSPRAQPRDERMLEVMGNVGSQLGRVVERERAEAALRASEAAYRAVTETANECIVTADASGRIVQLNPASERAFGLPAADAIGQPFARLFAEGAMPRGSGEARARRADGSEFPVEVSLASWRRGEESFVTGILHDITDRKAAEEEIRSLNADLEARVAARTQELRIVNKELESFSYSVSHDLRAPLRAIDGFSRMVLEKHAQGMEEAGQALLLRVRAATQRMGVLIDALLELSRLTRTPLARRDVDVTALVRAIVADLRSAEPQREVDLVVADGLHVDADPTLLRVVLSNLLGNAWKFTARRERARIEVSRREVEGEPAFEVKDDGAGFDMAYAEKLFRPFERLHDAGAFEGTGIGLATVQRIVHRHGGRIWAKGEPDRGATFWFTLPSGRDAPEA